MTIPEMSTFLFFIAPTTGGTKGGEQSSAIWLTQKRSPLTCMIRQRMRCSVAAMTITQRTNRPIIMEPPLTLCISKSEATMTEKMRMKNKKVLISGIVIGLVGYAVGTYLGVAIAFLLK